MSNCSRLKIIINDYYASLPFAALFSACKVSDFVSASKKSEWAQPLKTATNVRQSIKKGRVTDKMIRSCHAFGSN
jgi:hypothetical protein